MHKNKNSVLNRERRYMGDLHEHANQLLDNLADIKDVFDKYLAIKLYNWRYKWFCDHYESEWITDDSGSSFNTFDTIPYNVCMNWQVVLDKYFEDYRPIYLPSDKYYSDMCRSKLDNGEIISYYFRSEIPIPEEFEDMLNDHTATNSDGERLLMENLMPNQLIDFEKEMADYEWV
jgi:hypothetical protein